MGSHTSMVRASVSTDTASRDRRRRNAIVSGETAASTRTSTWLRPVRSSSYSVSRPNRIPPATPPARAGLARYMESMVSAEAGLYQASPAAGETAARSMTSQVSRLFRSRPSSEKKRSFFIVPPPLKSDKGKRPPATVPPPGHNPEGNPQPPGSESPDLC